MTTHYIDGPYFEDFSRDQTFAAPAVTVHQGHAALYQAITGDRMRLPLDNHLSAAVTAEDRGLVHPMLVINLVNGQTTYASQHVKGNLFYRGLLLQQPVFTGDTLTTTTRVVGLKQNTIKPGRAATGMVALEIETLNQHGDCVLKYWRCPMIPCRDASADSGHDDSFEWMPEALDPDTLAGAVPAAWDISAMDPAAYAVPAPVLAAGDRVMIEGQDTITCAPELVRMTGNIAFAHTDASRSYLGKRLVYGGHTISLALSQVTRAMPNIVTLIGWQGCDHLGPALEDDIIRSEFEVTAITPHACGGALVELHIETFARRPAVSASDYDESAVLDWRLVLWSL
jgi:2-methylfumaryl-CoA hydratase